MTYCKGRLQHQRIFPTHIFSCDNFYPYHDELLSVINKQYDNDRFKKGDIFKAAGYNKPALNAARGNVLEGNYHIQWTGPLYLK